MGFAGWLYLLLLDGAAAVASAVTPFLVVRGSSPRSVRGSVSPRAVRGDVPERLVR